jgi:hypothetical protein
MNYNCILSKIKTPKQLFLILKRLLYLGLSVQNKTVCISKDKIEKLNTYFKSLGFKIIFLELDTETLHMHYTNLLNHINEMNVDIIIGRHHKTDLIHHMHINEITIFLKKKLQNYFFLNYFEKWYAPEHLHDFFILNFFNHSKSEVVYFDYYTDYTYI